MQNRCREIPSKKAYEDDQILAFYHLDPQAPVHILIIPKEHISSANELTEENSICLGTSLLLRPSLPRSWDWKKATEL